MLKAGFSKVCISPPIGSPLAGFAARQGVSQGIHDDLFARALVLENGATVLALISVDLLALPGEFIRGARAAIQRTTGIPAESIMIASTHTHAGPVTITTFFNPEESVDRSYMDSLARDIVQSVSNAWEGRFPARVGVGDGRVAGVGVNRRSPDQLPVDEEVGIIRIDDAAGHTKAVFVNYSCHPTVLGPDNLLITGDFPSFAVERIERSLNGEGFAMFVNGTQGNISMGHSSELSAIGIITPGRTFERAAQLGNLLAEAALAALPGIVTDCSPALAASILPVNLPLKEYPTRDETARTLKDADERLTTLDQQGASAEEVMPAKTERLYASITDFYAREVEALNGHLPVELQGVRIGNAVLVAVPAEVFVEIGLSAKRRAGHKIFIVGIANGYIGYLPTREAYATGGYEVVSSKCRPEAADVLIEKVVELSDKLFDSDGKKV